MMQQWLVEGTQLPFAGFLHLHFDSEHLVLGSDREVV